MIEDDADKVALDAELYLLAQGVQKLIPQWFLDMNDAHHAEADRLLLAGDIARAEVFAKHDPEFDFDGISCAGGSSIYPCRALRAVHDGQGIWREATDKWPSGWEEEMDEWGEC